MIAFRYAGRRCLLLLGGFGFLGGWAPPAEAGDLFRKRPPAAYPTAYAPSPVRPAPLGTFYETPYLVVRGDGPVGGGYSPLNMYGNTSMDINGPFSSYRATAAPVLSYTRGYDGRAAVVEGTSFSFPFQPALSPVVYPTQATYFFGVRNPAIPPPWKSGINWVDQN